MAEGAGTKYSWRDLGAAFEPRESAILAGVAGLLALLVVQWVFWKIYGSDATPNVSNWVRQIVILVNGVVVLGLLSATLAAQAYVTRTDLLDERTAGARQALGFALRKLRTLILLPLIPLGLAAVCALPLVVAALLGKIPGVGWLLYPPVALLGYIGLVLSVLALLVFAFTLYLGPGIVAVRQEGASEAVIDVIGSLRGRGVAGLFLGGAATLFAGGALCAAWRLMDGLSAWIMGAKYGTLHQGLPFINEQWAYISLPLAFVLLLLFLLAGSYVLSVFSSAGTITFLWTIADEDWDMPLEPALPPEAPVAAAAVADEELTPPAQAAVAEPEPATAEADAEAPLEDPAPPAEAPADAPAKAPGEKDEQIFVPDEESKP